MVESTPRFAMGNRPMVFGTNRVSLPSIAVALLLFLALERMAVAQSPKVLTLEDAVNYALKNYPAVRAAMERVGAAQACAALAYTSYLPRAAMLCEHSLAPDDTTT